RNMFGPGRHIGTERPLRNSGSKPARRCCRRNLTIEAATKIGSGSGACGRKSFIQETGSGEAGRTIEEPGVTVKLIRTGTGDDVDDGTCVAAEFGLEIRCQKTELLNCVGPRLAADGTADSNLVIITAVESDIVFDAAAAVHADAEAVAEPTGSRSDARLNKSKVKDLAAVKRQADNTLVFDSGPQCGGLFVDKLDAGRDRNFSGRSAES